MEKLAMVEGPTPPLQLSSLQASTVEPSPGQPEWTLTTVSSVLEVVPPQVVMV
jgi:hypothetical protein